MELREQTDLQQVQDIEFLITKTWEIHLHTLLGLAEAQAAEAVEEALIPTAQVVLGVVSYPVLADLDHQKEVLGGQLMLQVQMAQHKQVTSMVVQAAVAVGVQLVVTVAVGAQVALVVQP